MCGNRGTRNRDESGQALVELAIVIAVLLVMMVGVFDLGRAIHAHLSVIHGARDGARVAMDTAATDAQITSAAIDGSSPFAPTVAINRAAGRVTVSLSYTYAPITPFLALVGGGNSIAITARMVSE